MVNLNGLLLDNINSCSGRFRAILSLIPNGTEWLNWAMREENIPTVKAMDENQLLRSIQMGLYADDYIRFSTFRLSIDKLISMSGSDVEQLVSFYENDEADAIKLQTVLASNSLRTYDELNSASGLIQSLMTGRSDLFQVASFSDLLLLAEAIRTPLFLNNDTQPLAYSFAQTLAATIPEFIDLYCFFDCALKKQLTEDLTPQQQLTEVHALYARLTPLVNYLLFTPTINAQSAVPLQTNTVIKAVESCTFIGYLTPTSAALNLLQNLKLNNDSSSLQSDVESFLAAAKNLVVNTPCTSSLVTQDGKITKLYFNKDGMQTIVGVDRSGTIFLLPGTRITNN